MSYLVGISGGSASGKTTVLRLLKTELGEDIATFISMDNYYKPYAEQSEQSTRGDINFDHPNAFNLHQFEADLKELKAGREVQIQEYVFNNPLSSAKLLTYKPAPILVIEGIMVFHNPAVKDMLDLKVYIDAPDYIRMARRIERDMDERAIELKEILAQYVHDAVPMYARYVEPHKAECNLIIPSNEGLSQSVKVLANHLKSVSGTAL